MSAPSHCDVTGVALPAPDLSTARVIGICCLPSGGWIVRALDGQQHISRRADSVADLHAAIDEYAEAAR